LSKVITVIVEPRTTWTAYTVEHDDGADGLEVFEGWNQGLGTLLEGEKVTEKDSFCDGGDGGSAEQAGQFPTTDLADDFITHEIESFSWRE
jgi:hypothetical protein